MSRFQREVVAGAWLPALPPEHSTTLLFTLLLFTLVPSHGPYRSSPFVAKYQHNHKGQVCFVYRFENLHCLTSASARKKKARGQGIATKAYAPP